MRPGFLLALEGLDGAGKTTLAFQIQEKLLALGLTALVFKEPTLGPMGLIIRQLTGAGRPDWLTPNQELELFLADRAWDVDNNIRPALQTGAVAILDRYILSSVVYQGALGLDPNYILTKNAAFPWPNATLILDITPDLALTRISYRTNNHLNPTFETSKSLTATAAILEDLDSYNLKGLYRLDGRKPLNKLATEALAILNPLLNL